MTEARFTLTVPAARFEAADALVARLEANPLFEPLAITINEISSPEPLWEIVLYFASAEEAAEALSFDGLAAGMIAPVPERDWVRQSLDGLSPVSAGRFFLHGSHDRDRRRAGGIALEIDAGTAFGTGHHGTTAGCLLALDRMLKRRRPKRILDLGCGTGVLAIAAARGAGTRVTATDIDPEAVRVTRGNAALNGARGSVISFVAAGLANPRIAADGPYDLIFANILARPLVALSTGLARALAPGGELILSGLTLDQMRWIAAVYRSRGLILRGRICRGEWATLMFQRAGGSG
ncbi:MAG: 50S ribosomal protein L11 methyltransferase [Aestuariivirga sp.]|uniref:50S ribosomal protein L11 methyltransferase n=1 Tax=Aestuariivirga sp. TaxID=2650926 RepID=UPI0038D08FB2